MPALPHAVRYPLPTAATPSAVNWVLDPDRAALLVHDMQTYFLAAFDHGADPYRSLVANVGTAVRWARSAGAPILASAQPGGQNPRVRGLLTDFWGPGLPADPALVATDPALTDLLDAEPPAVRLTKHRYSAALGTGLLDRLREAGRDQLVITGVYAGIGCLATALDAFMADVQPFVIADAVADFAEADHLAALEFVARRCGAVVLTSDLDVHAVPTQRDWRGFLVAQVRLLVGDPGLTPDGDVDLVNYGLDSVRSLTLIDRIDAAGRRLDMIDLLAHPTLDTLAAAIEACDAHPVVPART